jgi:hypothetical protein
MEDSHKSSGLDVGRVCGGGPDFATAMTDGILDFDF